jgi:microcystin-dependent protein
MSQNVILNGITYQIPTTGDENWGVPTTAYLVAIAAGCLQKTGGLFQLTADVNFGTTYGVVSNYFTSRTANSAATGTVKLANTDSVSFRDSANTTDLALSPNVSTDGIIQYGGVDLVDISSTQTLANKTINAPVIGGLTPSRALISGDSGFLAYSPTGAVQIGLLSNLLSSAVGVSDTQILSNKTLTSAAISTFLTFTSLIDAAPTPAAGTIGLYNYTGNLSTIDSAGTTKNLVDTTTTQLLQNKSLETPICTGSVVMGSSMSVPTPPLGQFTLWIDSPTSLLNYTNSAGNTGQYTTNNNTQTLTAKTLTSPVLTTPTVNGASTLNQVTTPAAPAASTTLLYSKTDSNLYIQNSSGVESQVLTSATVPGVPPGTILPYGGAGAPTGYLLCDGTSYSRVTYPNLFTVIGTAFGSTSGTTFNVPDTRGYFLRGWLNTASTTRDPDVASRSASNPGGLTGNNIGTFEADQFVSHNHSQQAHNHTQDSHNHTQNAHSHQIGMVANPYPYGQGTTITGQFGSGNNSNPAQLTQQVTASNIAATATNQATTAVNNANGGNETRPKNLYVNHIIKI